MTIPQLQNLLCDKFFIKQIIKRIKERSDRLSYSTTRRSSEFAQFYSSNNSKLTWQDTFQNILDMENSNIQSAALDYEKLGNIASIICENLLVTIEELEIPYEMAYIQQIIDTMPVIFVSNEHMHAFINLHEFVFITGALEYILSPAEATSVSSVGETEDSISCEIVTTSPNEPQESSKSKTGQPALIAKFPGIVDVVADFIKQHGFSAQYRRRTETGYSSGVSVSQIRDHFFENVDGLKEHDISPSTLRRIFEAPHQGRLASQRYMGYINARVGMKANSYQEFHQDAHYLFARNKQRREFTELFKDDISIFSMGDMNKIKVGPPAASRYHQLRLKFRHA